MRSGLLGKAVWACAAPKPTKVSAAALISTARLKI
jgi:hypothetical protein